MCSGSFKQFRCAKNDFDNFNISLNCHESEREKKSVGFTLRVFIFWDADSRVGKGDG